MSGKIPVSGLYKYLDMMLRDKWGYIYGTAGILWTQKRQDNTDNEMAREYGQKWVGHMVTDCSGVMVYIWRLYGLKIPHGSSSMVKQGYIVDCGKTPHPGWAALVDKTPDTPDNTHIGIVGADGVTVYEAKGTQSGFVTSTIHDKKWTKFGRFVDVDYSETGGDPVDGGTQVSYRAEVTTKSSPLNMRSGPGTEFPKIGKVAKGDVVDVWMEYPNGWRYVDDDGDTGYVDGAYLTPLPPATSVPDNQPTQDEDPPKTVKQTALRRFDDGAVIVLDGDWSVIYSTVGDD